MLNADANKYRCSRRHRAVFSIYSDCSPAFDNVVDLIFGVGELGVRFSNPQHEQSQAKCRIPEELMVPLSVVRVLLDDFG